MPVLQVMYRSEALISLQGMRRGRKAASSSLVAGHVEHENVTQILLRELQTVSVSPDMAADAMASVVITAPSKSAAKEGAAQVGPGCCLWSQTCLLHTWLW